MYDIAKNKNNPKVEEKNIDTVEYENDIEKKHEENEKDNSNNNYVNFDKENKDNENKDNEKDCEAPSLKAFRFVVGILLIIGIVFYSIFSYSGHENYKDNLLSGEIKSVNAGDILSKKHVNLEPKDISITGGDSYGSIYLSIWNFEDKEDGDYVEVFVNGSPKTEPFQIIHKPVKVSVPDKGFIQIRGIRDGSNNGITYGVTFSKTGETYLNMVPLNAANTYTIKTSR